MVLFILQTNIFELRSKYRNEDSTIQVKPKLANSNKEKKMRIEQFKQDKNSQTLCMTPVWMGNELCGGWEGGAHAYPLIWEAFGQGDEDELVWEDELVCVCVCFICRWILGCYLLIPRMRLKNNFIVPFCPLSKLSTDLFSIFNTPSKINYFFIHHL